MPNDASTTILPSARSLIAATLLAGCMVGSVAQAQQEPAVVDQIKQCAQLADAAARYACYDKAAAAAGMRADSAAPQRGATAAGPTQSRIPATVPAPAPAPGTAAAPVPAPAAEASPQGAPFDPPAVARGKQAKADAEANVYQDKITALEEGAPGQWRITLASGQQWYQVESKPYRMRTGMNVRIYPGLFSGAWRMSAEGLNGFIQVKRTK